MKIEYETNEKDDGAKLKQILKQKLEMSSRVIKESIERDAVTVNGKMLYLSNIVNEKDKIVVDLDKTIEKEEDKEEVLASPDIDIVYEDEYLLVINKEAGVSSHPNLNQRENTLTQKVNAYYKSKGYMNSVHIVNRLDRNTSGLCIFAKHKYIQELVAKAMQNGNFKKEYLAIVYGKMEKDHDILEGKIARKPGSIILREVSDLGDAASTEYFNIKYYEDKNYSALKIILHTGKTHQIRVHMADIGHPIVGDELYTTQAKARYNIQENDSYISRQALHAKKINLKLDILKLDLELTAKVPEDMEKLLLTIKKT